MLNDHAQLISLRNAILKTEVNMRYFHICKFLRLNYISFQIVYSLECNCKYCRGVFSCSTLEVLRNFISGIFACTSKTNKSGKIEYCQQVSLVFKKLLHASQSLLPWHQFLIKNPFEIHYSENKIIFWYLSQIF